MKFAKFFFAIFVFLFGASAFAQKTPQENIKEFYSWYLKSDANVYSLIEEDKKAELRLYVSNRLINEIETFLKKTRKQDDVIDHDYFTQSQDVLEDWADNIDVQPTKKANLFKVCLGEKNESPFCLKVKSTKESDNWKIDKVYEIN